MSHAKLSFEALTERVLSGEIAVETASPVSPWPTAGKAKAGSVSVFLNRDAPGAVLVVGSVRKRLALTSCFSGALRSHCAEFYSAYFNFELTRTPHDALRFVMDSAVEALASGSDLDESFFWVCGAEAAQLLRELKRVSFARSGEGFH